MVKYIIFLSLTILIFACSEEKNQTEDDSKTKQFEADLPLVTEDENGRYTEWYEGREQIKIQGRKDKEGRKDGIWKYFTERGVEKTITVYSHGKKDGHIVVRHPNGTIHYSGEYEMDKPVGVWKFYNDEGQLVERKFYDEE